MTDKMMSKDTAELLVLLYGDSVDHEELKALVSSAFKDGINYAIRHMGAGDEGEG